MIIQCEKCKTRFRLDDSKISDAGVRVRCSRCTHTFVVRRDVPEEEQDFDAILDSFGDSSNAREDAEESAESPEDPASQVGTEGLDATSPEPEPETSEPRVDVEEPDTTDSGVLPDGEAEPEDQFGELFDKGEEPSRFQFRFEDAGDTEDADIEVKPVGDDLVVSDEEPAGDAAPAAEPEEEPRSVIEEAAPDALEPEPADAENPSLQVEQASQFDIAEQPEPADAVNPPLRGEVRWPVADAGDAEAAEDEMPPLSISSRKKGPRLLPILLGTLLVLALGASGYYLMQGGAGGTLGMLGERVKRTIGAGEKSPVATIRFLEGKFVGNRDAGELFVMRGEVVNTSGKPVTSLRVRGTVYGPDGKALAQRTVFCGNTLSGEQLALQPYSSMEKLMGRQFGETLANLEVLPGKSVPFLIVFRNVPKGASDFGAVVFGGEGE